MSVPFFCYLCLLLIYEKTLIYYSIYIVVRLYGVMFVRATSCLYVQSGTDESA